VAGAKLETVSVPLQDIVIAHHALVMKAAGVVKVFGSGTPGGFGLKRLGANGPIVVGLEMMQAQVGGDQIVGSSQTQFAGEAILKRAPEAFDATFGLRATGRELRVSDEGWCQAFWHTRGPPSRTM
jgi:hypothetical protein